MSLISILEPKMNLPIVNATANSPSLPAMIASHHAELVALLHQYGAILFRGFACQDEASFSQAIAACNLGSRCTTSDYKLPRTLLQNDIYTSSDLPEHVPLPLHHEKPRTLKPPNHIYFCCIIPAQKGGGTLFANAESIWDDMPTPIKKQINQYGVVYKQFFHGKTRRYHWLQCILDDSCVQSWIDYFDTEERAEVEQKLMQDGLTWEWVNQQRDLVVTTRIPGALEHPVTHRINWFNSAAYLNYHINLLYGERSKLILSKSLAVRYMMWRDLFPMICHYGNGQPFSAVEIKQINQVIHSHTRVVNWQQGDFMVVDNYTYMHGKQPHEGNRLLYSCMTEQ